MDELSGAFNDKLPSLKVRNNVIYRNPDVSLPFDLRQGKPTDLGLFLTNQITEGNKTKQGINLGISLLHGRHGFIGTAICSDKNGTLYYDYDLKGVGHVHSVDLDKMPNIRVREISQRDKGKNSFGIWDRKTAERERDLTEELIKKGLRTYRIGAIIKLDEIALPNGDIISIKEAKKRGRIQDNEEPVIGLRVYRMFERLQVSKQHYFDKAKKIIEKELGKDLSWQEYFNWFINTLARNLAILHKAGYYHSAVSQHNVTLAGELIDLAFESGSEKIKSLAPEEKQGAIDEDLHFAVQSAIGSLGGKMVTLGLLNKKIFYGQMTDGTMKKDFEDKYNGFFNTH